MHKFGRMTGIIIKTNVQQVQVGYSTVKQTHCVSKNTPTLASCILYSFDKHGLILILFGKQHQHTFKNYMHIQLSLSLHLYLLSRRSRQRERLHATGPVHLFVRLFVSMSVAKMQIKRFSQKLSNLELRCLLTTYRKLCKLNWAFQRTHY